MVRYQTEEAYDLIAQKYAARHQAMPDTTQQLAWRLQKGAKSELITEEALRKRSNEADLDKKSYHRLHGC